MGEVTMTEIVEAVSTTFETIVVTLYAKNYDLIVQEAEETTEAIQDPPLLQVYPQNWEIDIASGTDRTTMGRGNAPVKQTNITLFMDLYARQRSHIGEDFSFLLPFIDAVNDELADQDSPFFGLTDDDGVAAIKAFHWRGSLVQFEYAEAKFLGARFELTLRIF